jgi:hypothetical protein
VIGVQVVADPLTGAVKSFITDAGVIEGAVALRNFFEQVQHEQIIVDDPVLLCRFADAAGLPLNVRGSVHVLERLLGEPVSTTGPLVDRFTALLARAPNTIRVLHDIEVAVQCVLARQRYVSTHPAHYRTPYILWRTLHVPDVASSPNFRIMALDPPVTVMRRDMLAQYYDAPRNELWVDVHWPYLQWHALALFSGDPALQHAVDTGGIGQMFEYEPTRAAVLRCNGKQPTYATAETCDQYTASFPTAQRWLHESALAAVNGGTILPRSGYVFRSRLRKTSEETYRSACTGILAFAEAQALRQAILRWDQEREQRSGREFLLAGSLMPMHDRLRYTLDRDVPVSWHATVAARLLHMAGLPAETVSAGPNAGTFIEVGPANWEVALHLSLRDEHVPCPQCSGVAMTERSLARHLKEVHAASV